MEVSVYNVKGEDTGRKVVLDDAVFGIEPNDHAIYLAVKLYRANQRQGTHKSKERSEMSGSTRKLGRQKGGGGARRGDINSPLLVGGARGSGRRKRDILCRTDAPEDPRRGARQPREPERTGGGAVPTPDGHAQE